MSKIGIIDYGAGNIQSVINAFDFIGKKAVLISKADEIFTCDRVVLPGVGAFSHAMTRLKERGFDTSIREFVASKRPFLGICLGMQLLFDKSYEFGKCAGLGLISGDVVKFDESRIDLKIPHVGWNSMKFHQKTPINFNLNQSEYFYFVHSFHAVCDDKFVLATSEYGYEFVSAVAYENVYGFQPHPEKSHDVGLKVIKNFTEIA